MGARPTLQRVIRLRQAGRLRRLGLLRVAEQLAAHGAPGAAVPDDVDRIEVVDYWTSAAHSFPYAAVSRVELECAPGSKSGWDIGYHIALSPGRWLDLMEDRPLLSHLADYERVNTKLVAAGVEFDFLKRTPPGREPFVAYSAACVEETIKDLDAAEGARVAALLHLGDWQSQSGASP